MSYKLTGHLKNADIDLEAGPPPPYPTEAGRTLQAGQFAGTSTSVYGVTETPVTVTDEYTQSYQWPSDMRSPSAFAIDDTQVAAHTRSSVSSAARREVHTYYSPPNMTYGSVADGNATLNNATYGNATLSNVTQVAEVLPSNTSTAVEVTWSQAASRRDRKP